MYLTYSEYTSMGGTLSETAFNSLEFESRTMIDWLTFNRLHKMSQTEIPEAVKRCVFQLIPKLEQQSKLLSVDQEGMKEITSQSNDGVSISYNVISAEKLYKLCGEEINGIINRYLYGVKDNLDHLLLYRGIYEDE